MPISYAAFNAILKVICLCYRSGHVFGDAGGIYSFMSVPEGT